MRPTAGVASQSSGSTRPVNAASGAPDPAVVRSAVADINAKLVADGESLQLSVDNLSGQIIVLVRDTQTGKVLQQVPAEDVLRVASVLRDQGKSSVLLDLKA
jgi:uncharacterized FlaG/YvyC family protein